MLMYSVAQRLDPATRKAWKLKGGDDARIPTFSELDRFLDSRARALEELHPANVDKQARAQKATNATASGASSISCPLCKASHFLHKCQVFLKKNPSQRLEAVKKANRCVNCLSDKHAVQLCQSKYSCRTCRKRHHSMLHVDSDTSTTKDTSTAKDTPAAENTSVATASIHDAAPITTLFSSAKVSSMPPVLLATARVRVGFPSESPNGRTRVVRALLDQGSEMTFITERLRQGLRLRRVRMPVSNSAIGGVDAGTCRYAAEIQISPIGQTSLAFKTTASVMTNLTKYTPSPVTSPVQWSHVADLALADADPTNSDPIDILIGADLYGDLLLDGIRKGSRSQPLAQNTVLGWVLSGPAADPQARPRTVTTQHCSNTPSLDEELRRFWEIEKIPRAIPLSPEEQQCEDHFLATHWRRSDGRYVIRFPFKTGPPIEIGNSYHSAERQLRGLERRLNADERVATEYRAFMEEYERLGHMKRVPHDADASSQHVYIPHHPVIRESSTTTRLRVVFNASNPTSSGTSLNDHLLTGQKLQTDLAAILLRWMLPRYVYSATLQKCIVKSKSILVTSTISESYGWVTPVTINAKIFLQQLWQAKVEWDEAIADDLFAQWKTTHASLATINGLHVDRWVRYGSDTANCELHGFCDASTTAFAAAVYIRVTSVTGETTSRLLIAKSKVALIKSLSIPRLELSAAVLLAWLLEFVRSSLQLTTIPCFCWTDALVVLAWVTQHPSKWKTFVANRVSEIQSRVPFATWRHVPTEDNPADCASRGILGCHLASHHLWWQGPSWLRRPTIEWPAQREPSSPDTTLEQNPRVTTHIVKPVEKWDLAARYLSWPKLIRITAYILRFASRTRRIKTNVIEASPLALFADECRLARVFWLRRIQEEEFPGEREALLS
ncbi:uncharacterized protein LOC112458094 [Temnothorax curvispinosus]|uniref:Uncharacterized protein LOC112458094 n=1 Tax=Temnothorax curvispinosus TaxID=300111 RepID=A0A6J1Q529_9HYME|nr:uncharacterized protein LOC112458094 [Temnothorax curvispinosus]